MKPKKQIWVHPDFARSLKVQASLDGKDVVEYSKELSLKFDEVCKIKIKKMKDEEKVRAKYKFGFN